MTITTKVGDRGSTYLFSGERVSKSSARTDAYGDLDELVSVLGIARGHARRSGKEILRLQRELFIIGAELATSRSRVKLLRERIDARMLAEFEKRRDDLEKRIKMPDNFIIPGGTPAGAHLDHARSIARRVERKVVGLSQKGLISNRHMIVWLNRLSDYLWLMARHEEGRATVVK